VAAGLTPVEMAALVKEEPTEALQRGTETLRRHARALLEFRNRGARVFEYGNTLRMRAADAGVQEALSLESFVTLFIRPLFCEGIGPFRWIAAAGDPAGVAAHERGAR